MRLLVLEFWGLGDLTFATPVLEAAQADYDITLVGKEHAAQLLEATFPRIRYLNFDAPWSAYRGKYALWKWNWPELARLFGTLRQERFDAAVSVRADPRDHLFMLLAGAHARYGFPRNGSESFLTHPLKRRSAQQHRVEDWWTIGRSLELDGAAGRSPRLDPTKYRRQNIDELFAPLEGHTVVCLHPGARIAVRRWAESSFVHLVEQMRSTFDFRLLLIPGPEGCSPALTAHADVVCPPLGVPDLVDVLSRVDVMICNDSGPGHIAAACGRPVIPIFGPTNPDWFRPWGKNHHVVIRDVCPWRPCFDYCKFAEPYCMTKLEPARVWPEIREHLFHLIESGVIPGKFARQQFAVAS